MDVAFVVVFQYVNNTKQQHAWRNSPKLKDLFPPWYYFPGKICPRGENKFYYVKNVPPFFKAIQLRNYNLLAAIPI